MSSSSCLPSEWVDSASALKMAQPTYKELIQLLEQAEAHEGAQLSTAELLTANFSQLYPHIKIGRLGRFLETVRRINGLIESGRFAKALGSQSSKLNFGE